IPGICITYLDEQDKIQHVISNKKYVSKCDRFLSNFEHEQRAITMRDLTNFGEKLVNEIAAKFGNESSNTRARRQFPLPDENCMVQICDDFSMECSAFMLAFESKTMKKRMNHVIRAYWPEAVRRNLVLKKSKNDRPEIRNVTSQEFRDLIRICEELQKGKYIVFEQSDDPNTCGRQWVSNFLKAEK
ncbi:hypothetical protein PV326_014391, partial [Microctonus aethiopoides]